MKVFKCLLLCSLLFIGGCGKKANVCKFEVPRRRVVSFLGVGDNLIHESIYTSNKQDDGSYDFSSIYENILDDIQNSDIAFINQETPIAGKELGLGGYPMFNTPIEMVDNLHDAGFNLINLASNHSLDRYESGIRNELQAFSKYEDMITDGVYTSQSDFDTIPVFKKNGITFSFLAYTYGTNGISSNYSYSVSYFDEDQIREDVKNAKEISDVVIVSAHWGEENSLTPSSMQKRYAQLFADLEVDVVIGTHPHVIQPIEWVKGKNGNETLVVYSLGNFIGGMLSVNNAISGMVQFDFVKENGEITVENVKWEPLFIHFERCGENFVDDRHNYKSYKLSEYTEELARKHALNEYGGQTVSIDYIHKITNQVIDSQYME